MGQEFIEGWSFMQTLGEGAFGEVRLLVNKKSQEAVAAKIVDLTAFPKAAVQVRKEILLHSRLVHENIIRYHGHRKEEGIEYIFLEYATGGELFDRIEPDVGTSQQDAHRYFSQIILGVEYLHSQGICHRDIKPENLLLNDKDVIKISDFGLATTFQDSSGKEKMLTQRCGTHQYIAPEILIAKEYRGEPVDIWSCGIVLVALLTGELPWDKPIVECKDFKDWKESRLFKPPFNKMNNLCLSLVRKILAISAKQRYTILQIKNHGWFKREFEKKRRLTFGMTSPLANKRRCDMRFSSSQPVPSHISSDIHGTVDSDMFNHNMQCFTQPDKPENMILNTQTENTQPSTGVALFQKLVKRMTRFFTDAGPEDTIDGLTTYFDKHNYTWKKSAQRQLTVETLDKRKNPLIFKTTVIKMSESILVDFRLSTGDGIEFKRHFLEIKSGLAELVLRGPVTWPLAIATNSVP